MDNCRRNNSNIKYAEIFMAILTKYDGNYDNKTKVSYKLTRGQLYTGLIRNAWLNPEGVIVLNSF